VTLAPGALALLCAASVATGALSAVVGMAGGITLLALMLLWLPPLVAIPLHAAVQLVSNSSRVVAQRRHVRWPLVASFAAPLLPMALLGVMLARALPTRGVELAIGLFVLVATWCPGWLALGASEGAASPKRRLFFVGGMVGLLSPTIGATGPLDAPFFLRLGLDRFQLIGTKAACATAQHVAKIAAFGVVGFAYREWLLPLCALAATAVAGTWLGTRLLTWVREEDFQALYRGVLTVVALRLAYGEALLLLPR
jgi:uncharacterized membrane protein YfcA